MLGFRRSEGSGASAAALASRSDRHRALSAGLTGPVDTFSLPFTHGNIHLGVKKKSLPFMVLLC